MGNTAEEKRKRNKHAASQEQSFVRDHNKRPSLCVAYHVSDGKVTDCLLAKKGGRLDIVDNKKSWRDEFIIDFKDINKGLERRDYHRDLGFQSDFYVDMWFPKKQKRRTILITDEMEDWSLKCYPTAKKIMCELVRRGRRSAEEEE